MKVRAWTVAQWLAIGVGTGAAGWVAVHAKADVPQDAPVAVVNRTPRRIPAAPSFHDAQPRVVPSPEPAPALVEARMPVQASTPSRAKRGTPLAAAPAAVDAPVAERSIASEIEELDRARAALGAGESKRAIDRLNRYDRMFPQGTLRDEALRLRIEALVSNGERATARTLAQRFRGLYPDSPHTERLKALVRDP